MPNFFKKKKKKQAIVALEKNGKKKATVLYNQRRSQLNILLSMVIKTDNNNHPITSNNLLPHPITKISRPLQNYSDIISDLDNPLSEMETEQQTNSSCDTKGNPPKILLKK